MTAIQKANGFFNRLNRSGTPAVDRVRDNNFIFKNPGKQKEGGSAYPLYRSLWPNIFDNERSAVSVWGFIFGLRFAWFFDTQHLIDHLDHSIRVDWDRGIPAV